MSSWRPSSRLATLSHGADDHAPAPLRQADPPSHLPADPALRRAYAPRAAARRLGVRYECQCRSPRDVRTRIRRGWLAQRRREIPDAPPGRPPPEEVAEPPLPAGPGAPGFTSGTSDVNSPTGKRAMTRDPSCRPFSARPTNPPSDLSSPQSTGNCPPDPQARGVGSTADWLRNLTTHASAETVFAISRIRGTHYLARGAGVTIR